MIIRLTECFACLYITRNPEFCALDTATVKYEAYKCRLHSMLTRSTRAHPAIGSFDTNTVDWMGRVCYPFIEQNECSCNVAFSCEGLKSLAHPNLLPFGKSLLLKLQKKNTLSLLWYTRVIFWGNSFEKKA